MLQLRNITKRFAHVLANDAIDLSIAPGTIHAIVGENGAGKSTAMRIAYGFYTPDEGEILVEGTPRAIRTPADAIALGIGMVHQHFMLVDTMTVVENIVLGAEPGSPLALDLAAARTQIRELSESFGLAIDPDSTIEELSVGQQQRVELLKALYRQARLLILDEPTAVLTPQETEGLFAILRTMRSQGKTVVIITHKLTEVLAISDEVTVMRDGRVVGRLTTSQTSAQEMARLMVGRDVLLRVEKPAANVRQPVLSVKNLTLTSPDGSLRLKGINLGVSEGEIVGVAGVEGNGQTELIEALAGLIPSIGSVTLKGQDITTFDARRRRELGIAHIPEDRHRRGLVLDFDLGENSILGVHYKRPLVRWKAFLDDRAIRSRATRIVQDFDVRPDDIDLPARVLSGGNQQKLVIGREFDLRPKLLLVAQPTRGVDIGAIEFIHQKLVSLRDSGCAILLVSSELEEVTALSDRLLVIRDGALVGEVDPRTASTAEIGLMMTGGANQ